MSPNGEYGRGYAPRLVLFVKAPVMGRAKTRLAAGIGPSRAAAFYRASTDALIRRLGPDRRWQTLLAVDPPSAAFGGWDHLWPPGIPRLAQGRGDLGERLRRILAALPPGPAIIIGTDAPQVARADIARALAALKGHDAVIGPAYDGGYWLVGLKRVRPAPQAFRHVRWSGPDALADTLDSLPPSFRVARLGMKRDIDEAADLAAQPGVLLRSLADYRGNRTGESP